MAEWQDNLIKITPYTPGEQPEVAGIIKLNTNENPYPPAPGVLRALREFDADRLRLYPNVSAAPIVKALAEYYGRSTDEIFVGVGSDDVLATAFRAVFNSDKPILFPNITYSFYDVWADLYRIPYECPKLDENFRIRKEDFYRDNGGIVLANPNAPTSIAEPLSFVEDIVSHNPNSVVIIDEAYIDFGGESALPLIDKYENLLVVQTFSKSRSMAGMRIGYAFGSRRLIRALNDVKNSYNSYTINMPAAVAGPEAVKDKAYFEEHVNKIISTREWTKKELERLGFTVLDSSTNFLFATHPAEKAAEIFDYLRENKVFVRFFNKPVLCDYLRITIGTDEQMKTFIALLQDKLSKK